MDILQRITLWSRQFPNRPAVISGKDSLTYAQLEDFSDRLALYLDGRCGQEKDPVLVYGHKNPFMLVCFLACIKSGRPYCPVDTAVSFPGLELILDSLNPSLILAVEELPPGCSRKSVLSLKQIQEILKKGRIPREQIQLMAASLKPVSEDEVLYIAFTSGTTGIPKGVQITCACLERFLTWISSLGIAKTAASVPVFLNQAPFSFDLSVTDVYSCLLCGGTLWCIHREQAGDISGLFQKLQTVNPTVLVSTPSFVDLCLSAPSFSQEHLPFLNFFLFSKEILSGKTAKALFNRFPNARVYNTYGPSEATVAVTGMEITPKLCETSQPLPLGYAKPGSRIEIHDKYGKPLPEGECGEIIVLGDTVSPGYYKNPFNTKKTFFREREQGCFIPACHTQDKGYLKDGLLFYCGRVDLQIKLHGYPVGLEDIECSLLKLPQVRRAAVLPNIRDHTVKSLSAYVVCPGKVISDKTFTARLKQELLALLPEYMIPKRFIFVNQFPVTETGKTDRQALKNMVS